MLRELNRLRLLFSRRDKLMYIGLLLMMGIGSGLEVLGVGMIPAFVATLAVPENVMAHPIGRRILDPLGIDTARELVIWGCSALMAVFLVKNAFLMILAYAQIRITEIHRVRLSTRLFGAYMNAPYEFHLGRNSAETLRNVQTETREIVNGIINPALMTLMGGLMTVGIIGLVVATTPPIVLTSIVVVGGGSALILRIFKKRLKQYGLEAKYERKESLKHVNQGLGSFVDARILARASYFIGAFHRSMAHFAKVDRLRQLMGKSSTYIIECIAVVGLLLVVLGMTASGVDAASLVPTLALFGAAVAQLRSSIGKIVTGISQMQYSIAAIPNVVDDLQLLEPRGSARQKVQLEHQRSSLPFRKEIRLTNVEYSYPDTDRPALREISLSIPKGSSVAFVGSTGSGKTTLVSVILGLLEPQRGTVSVDDANVFKDLRGWRQHIGYIPQSIFLVDDTIRRNIGFGLQDDEIDEMRLWEAIKAAQLEGFVLNLEKGVDTLVGERGVRISGGQRQRIGLARALYENPDVLILDEATSALDNQTESLVMDALNRLNGNRTMIVIAHRLSTVKDCDRLYFMSEGGIEAEGTYDDLSRTNREFKLMAEVA